VGDIGTYRMVGAGCWVLGLSLFYSGIGRGLVRRIRTIRYLRKAEARRAQLGYRIPTRCASASPPNFSTRLFNAALSITAPPIADHPGLTGVGSAP
jgi:hypothetical protein